MRSLIRREVAQAKVRLGAVLVALSIALSTWYYRPRPAQAGPRRQRRHTVPRDVETKVVEIAEGNPWYGYKRIAVICRRRGLAVSNRQVYGIFRDHDLLLRRQPSRLPELHQTAKLYELLPTAPNDLWQMDVTYIHVPGYGWWYAVTVIDYYSRYLLALRFTPSYSAPEVIEALKSAREEAERVHGPLEKEPFLVTDNGTSFLARRFVNFVRDEYEHVRIQYRTPTQLGLLERFHQTLKREEVYWRMYDNPGHARDCLAEFRERYNRQRPHWALVPVDGGDPVTPAEVYEDGIVTKLPRWQAWAHDVKKRLDELLEQKKKAS
jgi:transposase InsO family protein